MKYNLRIAAIVNESCMFKWQAEIIDQLHKSNNVSIDFILLVPTLKKAHTKPLLAFFQKIGQVFFLLHKKLDGMLFSDGNSLMRHLNHEKIFKGVKRIKWTESENDFKNQFQMLDAVLMFGRMKLSSKILDIPKYGFWDLTSEDVKSNLECLPGYWELVNHTPELITNLNLICPENQSKTIYQSSQITDFFSFYKNNQNHLKRLQLITLRVIQNLSEQGEGYFHSLVEKNRRISKNSESTLRSVPDLYNSLKNFSGHVNFLLQDSIFKFIYSDYWFVLIGTQKVNSAFGDFKEFIAIDSPKDRFWADPFVISRNDRHYIFVEELLYKTGKGRISHIELNDDGKVLNTSVVLEKEYHMSYPLIFQYEGVDYMIPETKENRSIDLYRCEKFPDQWFFVKTLIADVYAVDATPYWYEGKWWLFANVDEFDGNSSINDELYLFYSDDLFSGQWVSHPKNPIVSDVKSARPAGRIFEENGKIFRPSQDCSLRYGYALNMNRITKLSEDDYEEVLERKILPDWLPGLKRNHTINFGSNAAVIDAFKWRRKF